MAPSREAREALRQRERRLTDAIALKKPDRVPIAATFDYFPARYAGISTEAAFYDAPKWKAAATRTLVDFAPDTYFIALMTPGRVLELLGCRQLLIPGHGVPPDSGHQYVEGEYMKPEELQAFLDDPSDFTVRAYLPRIFDAFAPLSRLPRLSRMVWGYGEIGVVEMMSNPDFIRMFETIARAGHELAEWNRVMGSFVQEMEDLGFPPFSIALTQAPYDWLPDFLRGMKGSMLDLYRQPERVLEACDRMLPIMIEKAVSAAKASGNPRVFIPLHRGSDGFMSLQQFAKFYWPGLKSVCLALINEGLTPWVFFEGDYTSRLEYLLELPKGKVLAHLDCTDIQKARRVLGGHMAIMGNVPSSVLQTGTREEVIKYTRNLIETVGRDGGYVMACRAPMDETDPELVKVWMDTTRKYGVYK
jgi:hypothetical protein